MPAPTSNAEFIDLIKRSGVADTARVAAYLQSLRDRGSMPADPSKLSSLMVRDGILTQFQSEQLIQGKWKRFSIGKYKVLEKLGSGGMGQVFLCEHTLMRRRVAVKVLPTAKADDPASLERFYREARAAAALDHPNLVRAYDIDQDGNLHFLVMEYIDGASLQELVKRAGPLNPTRACHYVYWSAVGLQYASEVAGLVHRDVKPGNILVDRQGVVKILDMGLARFFNDQDDILTRKYDERTLGTADYLSPEQVDDSHEVDIRADIYSLGATFYYMLAGTPPFPDGTVAQKLIWHQTRLPTPMGQLRRDVPPVVAAILDRMLAKDPTQRFQSPADVAEALLPFVQTPIEPPAETELPQKCAAAAGVTASSTSGRFTIPKPPVATPRTASTTVASSTPTFGTRGLSLNGTPNGSGPQAVLQPPAQALPPNVRPPVNPFSNLLPADGRPSTRPAFAPSPSGAMGHQQSKQSQPTQQRPLTWSVVVALMTIGIAGVLWYTRHAAQPDVPSGTSAAPGQSAN
ncbi:MAG: protein kinase [Gemmataceae bacterium]